MNRTFTTNNFNGKHKQTPSLMDGEVIHEDCFEFKNRKLEDMQLDELLSIMESHVNKKISSGLQMIVQKIIVLVEEQVKFRVTEEVVDQMQSMPVGARFNKNLKKSPA